MFGHGDGLNFWFPHWLASSPLQHSRTTSTVRAYDLGVHDSLQGILQKMNWAFLT